MDCLNNQEYAPPSIANLKKESLCTMKIFLAACNIPCYALHASACSCTLYPFYTVLLPHPPPPTYTLTDIS